MKITKPFSVLFKTKWKKARKWKWKRKEQERKDRFHQNYLNRKANDKQKEYEDRYKEKREQLKQEKLKTLKKSGIPLSEYKKLVKKEA